MANGDGQQGLLGSLGNVASNPLFNLGIGLLSASGPSPTPTSFGQRLGQGLQAGQGLLAQSQENQLRRQALQERAQQREAQQQARQRLFEPGASVNTGMLPTPGEIVAGQDVGDLSGAIQERPSAMQGLLSGQQPTAEQVGLLAQAFPEQAGGLLSNLIGGDERAAPSAVRTVEAMGIDPRSEEGRRLLSQSIGGGQDLLDTQARMLDLRNQQLQIEERLRDKSQEAQQREVDQALTSTGFNTDIKTIGRLAELSRNLEGTIAQTGLPLGSTRRQLAALGSATPDSIANALGIDREQAAEIAADVQEFQKFSTDLALQQARRQFGGTITDNQLATVQQTAPSLALSPEANRRLLESNLSRTVAEARVRPGVELDQSLIERAQRNLSGEQGGRPESEQTPRSTPGQPPQQRQGPPPSRIRKMNRQQLQRLDPSNMTDDQLDAAAERFEELSRRGNGRR